MNVIMFRRPKICSLLLIATFLLFSTSVLLLFKIFATTSNYAKDGSSSSVSNFHWDADLTGEKLKKDFSWNGGGEDQSKISSSPKSTTSTTPVNCRNSIQGRHLLADDKGYVCSRRDVVSATGCCNASKSYQFACSPYCTAHSGCCDLYEHCVSCCMDPKMKPFLMDVLNEASLLSNILLLSVSDHFELCIAKCRTSSTSVQHENMYTDPSRKFCFKKKSAGNSAMASNNAGDSNNSNNKVNSL